MRMSRPYTPLYTHLLYLLQYRVKTIHYSQSKGSFRCTLKTPHVEINRISSFCNKCLINTNKYNDHHHQIPLTFEKHILISTPHILQHFIQTRYRIIIINVDSAIWLDRNRKHNCTHQ